MRRRFEDTHNFIVGTIGEPGEREFYLQFKSGAQILSFAIDKSQVMALVERFLILLKDLKSRGISYRSTNLSDLQVPLISEFTIAEMSISWNLDAKKVLIDLYNEDKSEKIEALFTPDQIDSFCKLASEVISAGRPLCPFCSLPIDKSGHLCPRANGYRR